MNRMTIYRISASGDWRTFVDDAERMATSDRKPIAVEAEC